MKVNRNGYNGGAEVVLERGEGETPGTNLESEESPCPTVPARGVCTKARGGGSIPLD
jgi:hypothetical protein